MKTKPVILLVEDFADARDMYREYLEYSGFTVETAGDGHEAIVKANEHNPDLILMDLSLPGLDGWEATKRLRADPATAHLTIVALSAHALAADWERARLAGCDGFIAKPCLPHDLVHEMTAYLRAAGAETAPARRTKKSN
jgi:two-component system, cell cycle response regulator DivK